MDSKDEIDKKQKRKILCVIGRILKKSSDGEYIYRGQSGIKRSEPGAPPLPYQVTSTLYRAMEKQSKEIEGANWLNVNRVQKEALKVARKFASEEFANEGYEDKKMLSRIQHHAGDTNLIDFTKDYLVALFFACSHKYGEKEGEDGKVFLLEISELKAREEAREEAREKAREKGREIDGEIDGEIEMITPVHPSNRVIGQKSIFIQPRSGIIHKGMKDITIKSVTIPLALKQPILRYLEMRHDISLYTIYNDLHGYIRNRKDHGNAVMEFYIGLNYAYKSDDEQSPKRKRDAAKNAIKHFDIAIELDPKYVVAYYNRGVAKQKLGDVSDAISDYDEAIKLDPKYAAAYNNRGNANLDCGDVKRKSGGILGAISDYNHAISDYDEAIKLNPKHAIVYNNRGNAKWKRGNVLGAIDWEDVMRDYDEAIKFDSEYAKAHYSRGLAKEELGGRRNLHEALSDFEKAKNLALQQNKKDVADAAQIGVYRVTKKISG